MCAWTRCYPVCNNPESPYLVKDEPDILDAHPHYFVEEINAWIICVGNDFCLNVGFYTDKRGNQDWNGDKDLHDSDK